jgi:hypothetical protein
MSKFGETTDLKGQLVQKHMEMLAKGARHSKPDDESVVPPKTRGEIFWIMYRRSRAGKTPHRKLKGLFGGGEEHI